MSTPQNNASHKYHNLNWCILILIILVNLYTISAPLLPRLQFWIGDHNSKKQILNKIVSQEYNNTKPVPSNDPLSGTNHLVVPSMQLNEQVFDGPDENTLMKGIWRRPNSSTPDKGKNTVLAAHRYTYINPHGTFYFLDKVKVGDKIALFWNQKKYVYQVTTIKTVAADQTEVESPTKSPQLTLYTCTPLWLPTNRLIVIARLL